jgi:DNA-binding PadR family transcriptional regulator
VFIGKKIQVPGQHDLSYAALIVLKAISDFPEGSYGYSLMQELTQKYNWHVKSGTVYPILKRLVEKKYIQKREGESRQKLYHLTSLGHELLKSLETELELIESRDLTADDGVDAFFTKLREYCLGISLEGSVPEETDSARHELASLKSKLSDIIDIIDQKLRSGQDGGSFPQ